MKIPSTVIRSRENVRREKFNIIDFTSRYGLLSGNVRFAYFAKEIFAICPYRGDQERIIFHAAQLIDGKTIVVFAFFFTFRTYAL